MSASGFHVYFGGTFDPPHMGHHEMLRALLADDWVTCVHVVPTGLNPLKSSEVETLGNAAERLAWVRAWLEGDFAAELARGRLKLESLELESPGPHYTVDTLAALRAREGASGRWVLCVGGDLPRDFHRWKDFERLFASLHSVWVFPRGEQAEPLAEMNTALRSLSEFRTMASTIREISSTEIRERLRGGDASQTSAETLLPPSVRARRLANR